MNQKASEHCKHLRLKGHSDRTLEDRSAESREDNGVPAQGIPRGAMSALGKEAVVGPGKEGGHGQPRGRRPFWYILTKNLGAFCPCPRNLPEVELESGGAGWWQLLPLTPGDPGHAVMCASFRRSMKTGERRGHVTHILH